MDLHFEIVPAGKNTPKNSLESVPIMEDLYLYKYQAKEPDESHLRGRVAKGLIQFYFAAQGEAEFSFHGGGYKLPLKAGHCLLFYNPTHALEMEVTVSAHTRLASIFTDVPSLHRLFVEGSEEIAFVNQENIDKKFYHDRELNPAIQVALNQLFQNNIAGSAQSIFMRAKVYEILALFFNREEGTDVEQCPFLDDEENVQKIRKAKAILIERVAEPPTIAELAKEIALNEYRLKEGFKNIYGKTVFQFLNDYRLDTARHILDKGQVKVNEAAYQIGYTNPSHFIAAFRKKFGVTPKKYLLNK
jgi:AraC-like DNA-binding protein